MLFNPFGLASSILPDRVKEWTYYNYQIKKANLNHDSVDYSLSKKQEAPDHVLLIVIDALRPDFVPDLSLEFTQAIAPAPWTFPSITSLHTGLRPSKHDAVAHTNPDDEEYAMPAQTDSHPHFPLDLEAAGYNTYAGCAFATPFLALRGWYQTHQYYADADALKVVTDYQKWRAKHDQTAAYLHFGDLHMPVSPPEEYLDRHDVDTTLHKLGHIHRYKTDFDQNNAEHQNYREQKFKLHRAALDYLTDQIQPLIDDIEDDTLIVVTGDHGEALWEHQKLDQQITDSRPHYCFGHGGTPFDTVSRVPLAISSPSHDLKPTGGWGSLRDIPATVLDSTIKDRQAPSQSWQEPIPTDRAVVCEGCRYGVERKAVYQGDYKLIRSESDDVTLTAKISNKGEEFTDISESIERRLLDALPQKWSQMDTQADVSDMTEERLEALGYR